MKTVAVLIAVLSLLAACAPSTERVLGNGSHTYLLQKELFERSAEFIVRDVASKRSIYRADPSAVSLRQVLVIRDVRGPVLGRVVRRVLALAPTFEIYRDGERVVSLGQNLTDFLSNTLVGGRVGERYTVSTVNGSPNLEIRGSVFSLNYDLYRQGERAGHIFKAPLARNYFVEVAPGQDDVLLLEIVIALNELTAAQTK